MRKITIRLSEAEFMLLDRRAAKNGTTVTGEAQSLIQAQALADTILDAITAAENRTAERIHGAAQRVIAAKGVI